MRWAALGSGAALVIVAFVAGSQVADTQAGLLAEITALFAGGGGVGLLIYGLVFAGRPSVVKPAATAPPRAARRTRSLNDLLLGSGGLVVATGLATGLALNGGPSLALMGLVMLAPMVAGCGYLCIAFIRAPEREWRLQLPGSRPRA